LVYTKIFSMKKLIFVISFLAFVQLALAQEVKKIEATSEWGSLRIENTGTEKPVITLILPEIKRGFKATVADKQLTIIGKAEAANGIYEVLVNDKEAVLDAEGKFRAVINLVVGENSFTVKAVDGKQNTVSETYIVVRNPQNVIKENNTSSKNITLSATGKYYGLFIGVNQYNDANITALSEPINDAQKLYNALTQNYTFSTENSKLLKNPINKQIVAALDELSGKVTETDNVLIFYAGHGYFDEKMNVGYWLPADATKNSRAKWFSNSVLRDYIGGIKSKHTLVIADACFSGSIFKSRKAFADANLAINKLYELSSRKVMTSGTMTEVPDKSVFTNYLLKRLNENTEKYLATDQLFSSFRDAVLNNSATEPQYGIIQNVGDEGGEFIFIKK